MEIVRSMHEDWLVNSYLAADRRDGSAVLIDAGAPMEPLLARADDLAVTLRAILITHHHPDHIAHAASISGRFGIPVLCHPEEREWVDAATGTLGHGEEITFGGLRVRALHVPGHTRGHLAFAINGTDLFTGDVLFQGAVGGTVGHGNSGFADLKNSVANVLMKLPRGVRVHPGHAEPTTIGAEWESNPFVRAWSMRGAWSPEPCSVRGESATLLLRAADYDGGTKAWIRREDGVQDIVPGSWLE